MMASITRRGLSLGGGVLASASLIAPAAASIPVRNSDAELIATCRQHLMNRDAYNASRSDLEPEDDPLWAAYVGTLDAIDDAKPQTLAGLAAKAGAAKVEARNPDGSEDPEYAVAARWAWDLVNDLVRLSGRASA